MIAAFGLTSVEVKVVIQVDGDTKTVDDDIGVVLNMDVNGTVVRVVVAEDDGPVRVDVVDSKV